MKARILKKRKSLSIEPLCGYYMLKGDEIVGTGDFVARVKKYSNIIMDYWETAEGLIGGRLINGVFNCSTCYYVVCRKA
jgi:hypothetical protein